MERAWKITCFFVGFVLIGLCSGFPTGLENSAADYHTQFLTGLVGVLLTVCGVVFLIGCLCCQRKHGFKDEKKKQKEFHNSPVVASSTSSLDHGHINPIANGEFTIFTPLSPAHHNNNVFLANEQIAGHEEIDYNHADIDVHSWFDGTETDFPRTKLKYIKELGKGWFGRVVEGTAQGLSGHEDEPTWRPVVVRILEASATSSERAVFLHDAVIYRCGKHPHVLQLLGRSLESVPLLLLQEICPRGDLKKYLRDNRGGVEKLLSSDLPLLWCCQLSSALKHLHDHRLMHPDLATRNCQIVSDLSLKLGDYGLSASLYPEDYYQGAPAVPVRWCAPESLTYTSTTIQPKQTTFESNVWALGVTMWEIHACGAQPYAQLTDDDVILHVLGSTSIRLPRPDFSILYTDYIFRLMQLCWSTSESRPSVSQVHLMLTDLMQVYQNTKHLTGASEPLISLQDFDKRWDTFKPNHVAVTDNHEFSSDDHAAISMADVDLSNITILNMNLDKEDELLSGKTMSPSLNNLHGSLDNLAAGEMDSWLQKVATKTGDMSYVRGLSQAIQDLDNALALENVSSSDSSHQPSPAPENLPKPRNPKLEFQLGPGAPNDAHKTQNSSLTESVQRTSSESETEDENWRRKIERGAYSEKVRQKSKSVTDLMVLTHIDCSESDSETPLPSLDYRVNYRNVRYAPKQNLENASLMFGSEGNLLSVHDKFQDELRRLQEEHKDSLLFVPESISHSGGRDDKGAIAESQQGADNSSSDEETWTVRPNKDAPCTYVNTEPIECAEQQPENPNLNSKNVTPNHRNPESLLEELSHPTDIQPANQVYNIFNVTVDTNFSPKHLNQNLKTIICYDDKDHESTENNLEYCNGEALESDVSNSNSPSQHFDVPKLTELIQNNDELMDYIIAKYEAQEEADSKQLNSVETAVEGEVKIETKSAAKELNNNIHNSTVIIDCPTVLDSPTDVQTTTPIATEEFLRSERQNYDAPKVQFDVSSSQEEIAPNSMTHSAVFTSTPHEKRTVEQLEPDAELLQFSSNFADFGDDDDDDHNLKYSLETWDNYLGKTMDGPRDQVEFGGEFSSEPQSLLFVDDATNVEGKKSVLIDNHKSDCVNDLSLPLEVKDTTGQLQEENVPNEQDELLSSVLVEDSSDKSDFPKGDDWHDTFNVADVEECLERTYTKEDEGTENPMASGSGCSNWEPGEGWFLHPQTNSEVSGQMEASPVEESYVGFSMDDDVMAAIRNELLMKLPQAQGQSSEQIKDSDDWDSEGRSEVLIRYNLYTTPLSPIPEESYSENDSHHFIYNREDNSDSENGDWPEPYEDHNSALADADTETRSMQNAGSPVQEPQNRHTPSQDSCCSNDTLFNLEELTYVVNENELQKMHVGNDGKCDVQPEVEAVTTEANLICEESTLKNTGVLKSEIFTCDIEPVGHGESPKEPDERKQPEFDGYVDENLVNENKVEASKCFEIACENLIDIPSQVLENSMDTLQTPQNNTENTNQNQNGTGEPEFQVAISQNVNSDVIKDSHINQSPEACNLEESEVKICNKSETSLDDSESDLKQAESKFLNTERLDFDPSELTSKKPFQKSDNFNEAEFHAMKGEGTEETIKEETFINQPANRGEVITERTELDETPAFSLEEFNLKPLEDAPNHTENDPDPCQSEVPTIHVEIDDGKINSSVENHVLTPEEIEAGGAQDSPELEPVHSTKSSQLKHIKVDLISGDQIWLDEKGELKPCDNFIGRDDEVGCEDLVAQPTTEVSANKYEVGGLEADLDFVDFTFIDGKNDGAIDDVNKLNLKNTQNGVLPGNSLKWINGSGPHENTENLTDDLENLEDTNVKNSELASVAPNQPKDKADPCVSLIVENNPNYITEFLNHERQSSISSLGSSKDEDDDSLNQISNGVAPQTNDYVNIDDIAVKLVVGESRSSMHEDTADYVNVNELLDLSAQPDYVNVQQQEGGEEHLYDPVANDEVAYDALTDIRFTGPSDVQLMSTSFSESADIDEQDWDSGSDTRSSSSGEFIWKEGEHEESVKALRAAPQDLLAAEKSNAMDDIEEVSTESSDEDGDSPEFVPSAWDKYATPTKSALRSPEKTLEKADAKCKKPKGVWFKKQKYHCVYEYPREPETPNINNYELWQPIPTSLIDWEVDTGPYVHRFDGPNSVPDCYQIDKHARNIYQLPDFATAGMSIDDEFFISSTARPFESYGGLSSQFFPGKTTSDQWMDLSKQANDNITPDSGMEDITPGGHTDGNEFLPQPHPKSQVQTLKLLATAAMKHNHLNEHKSSKDSLGGLRHARNKLKLDLPPSPSAFTSTKAFTIEPPEEPVTKREVPTFTTFGKSRFSVQHVDTPTNDDAGEGKNVSFEALPYKPVQQKVEIVRGEASLLDSADEDSGIESSTLEREKITNVAD